VATAAGIGHVNLVKFGSVVFELREYRHTDKTRSILKNVGPIRHCEPFYIAIHQVSLLSQHTPPAHRCLQRQQRQRVTARDRGDMAPWNGPKKKQT